MKRICLAAIAVGGLFMFTACGSDDTARDAPADDSRGAGQQGGGQRGGMPGASGKIAAADGSTIQVQGSDSQTAVTYTDKTAITQQVAGSLSDVKAGVCVMVTPADGSESSDTAVTAGSIRVTEKTDGSCQGGFGGGRPSGMPEGGMPSGMPEGEMPSGAPQGGMPSGGPGGGGGFGTSGEVTAVSGDTITVAATGFDPQAEEGAEPETATVTVTTTGETTVTTTTTADASALAIGRCVTASGTADDTGAVSAERIEVSDAVDGECSTGFGRGGFPGGGGSQDGASS
ncbi:DUF5666 domain-containing protein [Nocardioides sp. NPDC058538]|uniref:DUF5666 domain-containing protein n=1 Tax=Nocardioides sp. NPDC058538 TaxID=3346542 RepID=UPI0036608C6B